MTKLSRNFEIAVIESPYDTWATDPLVADLFCKAVGLKLRGYSREYPYGVLPVDTTDFICDHLLVCERRGSLLEPVLGLKSVSLRKCKEHKLPFPALTLVQQAKARPHDQIIEGILDEAERCGRDVVYTGSWTIDPNARKDPKRAALLHELFVAIYVLFHQQKGLPEIIAGATMRFKVERFARWLGHEPLALNGMPLLPIRVAHLAGEKVLVTHLKTFCPEAEKTALRWRDLWKNRTHIENQTSRDDVIPTRLAG